MSILTIQTDFAGESAVTPRLVRVTCNDNLAAVTAQNYLKAAEQVGYVFIPSDFFAVAYQGGSDWFIPSIDGLGNITLVNTSNNVTVSGSVTPNDLVSFINASTIADVGYKILFGLSSTFAGGGTTFSFAVPGATIASTSMVAMKNQTNSASITSYGTVANQINVTFSADPGISTVVSYITIVPHP